MVIQNQALINSAATQATADFSSECGRKVKALRPVCRLAEQYCINWCHGGICEGVDINPQTGRHFRWRAAGGFCLLALGGRCPYFEAAVLPMETRKEWPTLIQGEAFRKAARLYHLTFPETVVVEPTTRKCPDCGKGFVQPKKQYCAKCRIRRRKATDALNHRNHRKQAAERHTKEEISSALVADPQAMNSEVRCGLSAWPEITPLTV
jgi:hypothetical protein